MLEEAQEVHGAVLLPTSSDLHLKRAGGQLQADSAGTQETPPPPPRPQGSELLGSGLVCAGSPSFHSATQKPLKNRIIKPEK